MNQSAILLLVGLLIVFGAINIIQLKLQNIHVLNQQTGQKFFHPFVQTILLFIGQSFVGFFYLFHCYRERRAALKKEEKEMLLTQDTQVPPKKKASFLQAFWPSVFDLLATLFSYLALNTVDSSVWQMSKGGVIVTTAILSKFFLRRVFTNRAILGCSLAFVGITGVQAVAVLSANSQSNLTTEGQLVGIALLFISILFNSFGLIIQKKIFDKFQIHPLKMVYAQGVIGFILMSLIAFGFQYIPCPWTNKTQCVCLSADACYLQNYNKYFYDLGESTMLILLTIGFICSIAISVPIGAFLSKEVSPISRSLANVSRTLLIWVFNIVMTETLGQTHEEYSLESRSALVNCLKGVGFGFLMFGTFLYHGKKQQKDEEKSLASISDEIIPEKRQQPQLEGARDQIQHQKCYSSSSKSSKNEAETNFDSQQYEDELAKKQEMVVIN